MSWGYAESGRDDMTSIDVICRALDQGVNFVDTARVYGDGHNEELVGRAIRNRREEVVVASKGGLVVDDLTRRTMHRDGRPQTLRRQVFESLQNLAVEHIDLYYLHRVDDSVPLSDSIGALADMVDEGLIGAIGLSEVTVEQADAAAEIHPIAAIQSELSLWTRGPMGHTDRVSTKNVAGSGAESPGDIVGWCKERGALFVAFAPLGRGFLTGAYTSTEAFEDGDFRASNPRYSENAMRANQAILAEVGSVSTEVKATLAQVALAWLLGLGAHVQPISGTRKRDHLAENLAARKLVLNAEQMTKLTFGLPSAVGSRY